MVTLSLLQVMCFFIAWVGCWLPLAILFAIAIDWRPTQPITPEQKLPLLVSLYLIVPLVLWGASRVTGTSFSDYGLARNFEILYSAGIGFGSGSLSLLLMFGIETGLGWVTWQLVDRQQLVLVLLSTLLLAIWVSGIEELVFRGFVLTQLQHDYQPWIAAGISSLVFALLHLVWEQKATIPQLPGLWLLGMILVLARYIDSGSLGLAWGLHAGWVWVIASLDSAQMLNYTAKGVPWLTGQAGKPLASAIGIFCLLLTGIILWLFFR